MLNIVVETRHGTSQPYASDSNAGRQAEEAWLNHHLERGQEEGDPFAVIGWLTPVLADLLLARNDGNRSISHSKVNAYVRDIVDGNYELNGETIKISADGQLNDGQHRCRAVMLAGKPIRTFFVFGLERSTRATVDQGRARTAGDILAFDGVEDANTSAAVASLVYQYLERGKISTNTVDRPTRQQLRDLFDKDDDSLIQASIQFVGKKGLLALGGRSVIAFCHYVIKSTGNPRADFFIQRLISGEQLSRGNPIFYCRGRLLNSKRLTVNQKAELIFRAWNFFYEGRSTDKLPINDGPLPKVWG